MALTGILDHLDAFSFFGGIEPDQLAGVSDLFEVGRYPAGTRIIEQDEEGNRLYIVTSGRIEIRVRCSSPGEEDQESVLFTVSRGSHCGEMELIDTQRRSASAVALEDTETLELTNMGLYQIFHRDPDVFRQIMMNLARDLSRKLRSANLQLATIRL